MSLKSQVKCKINCNRRKYQNNNLNISELKDLLLRPLKELQEKNEEVLMN
jgi:hypothetical protein